MFTYYKIAQNTRDAGDFFESIWKYADGTNSDFILMMRIYMDWEDRFNEYFRNKCHNLRFVTNSLQLQYF